MNKTLINKSGEQFCKNCNALTRQSLIIDINQNSINHPSTTSKIGWIEKERLLISLHNQLFNYGLIDSKFDAFQKHFWGNSIGINNYIKWYGEITQLVYLFDLLITYNCIPNHRNKRHKILIEHFCNRFGETLNNTSLRTMLNQLRNESNGCTMINEIFEKLENDKTS
ncbi:MAG: hypothetical protein NTZ33_15770 [Bacteroidetes bacterium]|nr:hypothetical protein [Bacteroidota bacterium]